MNRYTPYELNRDFLREQKLEVKKTIVLSDGQSSSDAPIEMSFWDAVGELFAGGEPKIDEDAFLVPGVCVVKGSHRYEINGARYLKDLFKLFIDEPKIGAIGSRWYFLEQTSSSYDTSSSKDWNFFVAYGGKIICELASLSMDMVEELPRELFVDRTNPDPEYYSSYPSSEEHALAWARGYYQDYYKNFPTGKHRAIRLQNAIETDAFGSIQEGLDVAPEAIQVAWLKGISFELVRIRNVLIVLCLIVFVILLKTIF